MKDFKQEKLFLFLKLKNNLNFFFIGNKEQKLH